LEIYASKRPINAYNSQVALLYSKFKGCIKEDFVVCVKGSMKALPSFGGLWLKKPINTYNIKVALLYSKFKGCIKEDFVVCVKGFTNKNPAYLWSFMPQKGQLMLTTAK